jgi:CRP/FNR family transcriptional regulator
MLNTQITELRPTSSGSAVARTSSSAAWPRQAKLWSSLKEVCDLLRIPSSSSMNDNDVQFQHIQFKAGQRIHTIGQTFDMLYIVYSGFLKTVMIDESGNEQVLGFPMKGDLFGIDGIHSKQYTSEAVALSTCEVVLLPFKTLLTLGRTHSELEHALYGVMSGELVREQGMVSSLGSLSAEARVARFLVFLAGRFTEIGYSGKEFNLRMTRQEIGNYLGLTIETVSRTLSAFNAIGLISISQRAVVINDVNALKTLRRLPPRMKRESEKSAKPALVSVGAAGVTEQLEAA